MLNYNYKIPVMCIKKLFDENIQTSLKEEFLNVLNNFENIIKNCLTLRINNIISTFNLEKYPHTCTRVGCEAPAYICQFSGKVDCSKCG